MSTEWVQDTKTETWHLVWEIAGEDAEEGVVTSWCHKEFKWDDPHMSTRSISWATVLHDDCLRKSEQV